MYGVLRIGRMERHWAGLSDSNCLRRREREIELLRLNCLFSVGNFSEPAPATARKPTQGFTTLRQGLLIY